METNKEMEDLFNVMQKLLDVLKTNPELAKVLGTFLTNVQKVNNKKLLFEAINAFFIEDCFFTQQNVDKFKERIKYLIYPKILCLKQIDKSKYEISEDIIGNGAMSLVLLGTFKVNKKKRKAVAVKILKLQDKKIFLQEVMAMCKLQHDNILSICGFNMDKYHIITEYMELGNLNNINTAHHSNQELYKYISDIVNGIEYIHDHKFVHRDIASRNIFVNAEKVCKIGDFGFTVYIGDKEEYRETEISFTSYNMSPESIENGIFSYSSDIFSFALLIWELMMGKSDMVYLFIKSIIDKRLLKKPKRCPDNLFNIIHTSFHPNPKQRPAIKDYKSMIKTLLK